MEEEKGKDIQTTELPQVQDTLHKPDKLLGVRHFQVLLFFFLLLIAYALRGNMSLAIVAMTDATTNPDFVEYDWDLTTQSTILSSFFWGYLVAQIPGGMLAKMFGAKILLLVAICTCSVLTLLTPLGADIGGWGLVCGIRVVLGITQGFVFPCTHTFLSKWVPPSERSRLGSFVYAGSILGNVVMLAISGEIASSALGWPSIFYISGAVGLCWTILFFFFGTNTPAENRFISEEEKVYIQQSLGQNTDIEVMKKVPIPWKSFFTSLPFISIIVVQCAQNWGFFTLLTEIPTYIKQVLGQDIKANALMSALPYFVLWLLTFLFSGLSDFFINKGYLSTGNARKLFNSLGHYFPMVALIGLGYVTKDNVELAIALLTVAVGMNAGTFVGFILNHMDLSPVYAGTMMGISNGAATIMSILGPLFVGLIVKNEEDPAEWRIVFFVAAGVYLVGNTFFIVFGKGEIQPWNYEKIENNPDDQDKNTNIGKSSDTVLTNVSSRDNN